MVDWIKQPDRKLTIKPGETWEYSLPVSEKPDSVTWESDFIENKIIEVDPDDPRKVRIDFPQTISKSFGQLKYSIGIGGNLVSGEISVRIQKHFPQTSLPTSDTSSESSISSKEQPTGPSPKAESTKPVEISPTKEIQHQEPSTLNKLIGDYEIQVVRNGIFVPELKTPVLRNKTINIGRGVEIEDLNLAGKFASSKLEKKCSRHQAEVFWKDDTVIIKTTGRRPMMHKNPEGKIVEIPSVYTWPENEHLMLPGELELVLRKRKV